MPPKPKFTKEQILDAALLIARTRGANAIVAREVGNGLGTSSSPIFTFWSNMDELIADVKAKAYEIFGQYLAVADDYVPAFKMRGMQFVKFASDEPHLFQLLFIGTKTNNDMSDIYDLLRYPQFEKDFEFIGKTYSLTHEETEKVFNNTYIRAYAMCMLCATGAYTYSREQCCTLLGECFESIIYAIKNNALTYADKMPAKAGAPESELYLRAFNTERQ